MIRTIEELYEHYKENSDMYEHEWHAHLLNRVIDGTLFKKVFLEYIEIIASDVHDCLTEAFEPEEEETC